jgi:hypothetical protein
MTKPVKVVLLAGAIVLGIVALNPPWIATGVKSRMNFDDFPRTPPRMVTDTVQWRVLQAFLFSPPTLDLPPERLTELQVRRSRGDKTVAEEWKQETQKLETRANVPAELRTVWLPTSAGTPEGSFRRTLVSSEFEVQWGYLIFRLLFIAIVTAVIAGITALISRARKPGSAEASRPVA